MGRKVSVRMVSEVLAQGSGWMLLVGQQKQTVVVSATGCIAKGSEVLVV